MAHTIVLGTQWGDEGKGKVVHRLARDADLVVRFQGGANAGHTIFWEGRKLVLHQLPSGIVHRSVVSVIGNGCVVDPVALDREIEEIVAQGVEVGAHNLKVSGAAQVVTPAHRRIDNELGRAVGTTGRGIGPCYADEAARTGLRLESMLEGGWQQRYADLFRNYASLSARAGGEPWGDPQEDIAVLEAAVEKMGPLVTDTAAYLHFAIAQGGRTLFEGAQGTMLDIDHGTYPFVTSSSTTIGGAYSGSGAYVEFARRVGIVKAYTTRVGNGPFPTEEHDELGAWLRQRGGEYGATTGRPRRCGWLDLELVRRSCAVNGLNEIAMTKLDCLTGLAEVPVASGRAADGTPEYVKLPGWKESLAGCREASELPGAARRYVELVEQWLGVRISMVSTGPGDDDLLFRETQ
ncbi:MAG: adenylosuccinate synthase [Deltaproteobacteria bacterium]|nr:adenylosuccinate synthase [Deltaproteobacteria bacterium]